MRRRIRKKASAAASAAQRRGGRAVRFLAAGAGKVRARVLVCGRRAGRGGRGAAGGVGCVGLAPPPDHFHGCSSLSAASRSERLTRAGPP